MKLACVSLKLRKFPDIEKQADMIAMFRRSCMGHSNNLLKKRMAAGFQIHFLVDLHILDQHLHEVKLPQNKNQ